MLHIVGGEGGKRARQQLHPDCSARVFEKSYSHRFTTQMGLRLQRISGICWSWVRHAFDLSAVVADKLNVCRRRRCPYGQPEIALCTNAHKDP